MHTHPRAQCRAVALGMAQGTSCCQSKLWENIFHIIAALSLELNCTIKTAGLSHCPLPTNIDNHIVAQVWCEAVLYLSSTFFLSCDCSACRDSFVLRAGRLKHDGISPTSTPNHWLLYDLCQPTLSPCTCHFEGAPLCYCT